MSRFNRPNPDQWRTTKVADTELFVGGELRIELWETDDAQVWVLVCDDGGPDHQNEHAPLTDSMAAMMLRVMRDE